MEGVDVEVMGIGEIVSVDYNFLVVRFLNYIFEFFKGVSIIVKIRFIFKIILSVVRFFYVFIFIWNFRKYRNYYFRDCNNII